MTDTGGKFAQGLRGFPTPEETGIAGAYLLFLFGDNPAIAQTILGALEPLVYPDNWYIWGDMSEDDAAEYFREVIEQAPYNLMPQEIGAPYWDDSDAADADDEEERDVQEWYGEVEIVDDELTFTENLQIWIIAGFVMLAASPLAAITFIPIAKRFTLAFKKHDLGGIIRAFVDGIEVNQADTYATESSVGSMSIAIPPTMGLLAAEDTPHTLTLVMSSDYNPAITGTPNIQLFRQRLSEADFSPPYLRYHAETDAVQYTPDGGTTWTNAPEFDPRHSSTLLRPPLTTSDVRCDSAANMVKWLHDFIDALIAAGSTASEILLVVNVLLEFLELLTGFASVIINLIVEAAGTLATIGSAALDAAFTSDQYDLLLCIFYCNMDTAGNVSIDQLTAIQTAVTNQLNATAAGVVNLILGLQGETGLTNAGRIGSETGDCSGCECPPTCHEWTNAGTTSVDALYTYRTFQSTLTPSVNFTQIKIDWTLHPNSGATLHDADLRIWLSGSGLPVYTQPIGTNTGEFVVNFDPAVNQDAFIIAVRSYFIGGSNYPDLSLVHFEYLPDDTISWSGGTDC